MTTNKPPTKPTRSAGRRSLLTVKTHTTVLNHIRNGLTHTDAARLTGIGHRTFYDWRTRGEQALDAIYQTVDSAAEATWDTIEPHIPETERPYARFAVELATAETEGKQTAIEALRAGMADDWRAAAWYLERKYPDEYSRQATTNVNVTGRIASVALDPTDTDTLEAVIAAAGEIVIGETNGNYEEEEPDDDN